MAEDQLSFAMAVQLAQSLTTIDHPRAEGAINGTAQDLVDWCRGAVIDGRTISPENQAYMLVTAARRNWGEWKGTGALYQLFREMFDPKPGASQSPAILTYEETVARGLILPPCEHCDDSGYTGTRPNITFCSCRHGRHQQKWEGERGLERVNAAPTGRRVPVMEIDLGQILAHGQELYEEEQRRKAEQLKKAGIE
jgi:hypothetical protein